MLEVLTPIGAALAWVWHESRKYKKDLHEKALSEADRERSYSERLEVRLKNREIELEKALTDLMDCREGDPKDILESIIYADHGISWAEKDDWFIGTRGEGRTFIWRGFTIGIGYD